MSPNSPQRRWKQDPAGRRQRILEATEAEIAKRGIQGWRTPHVADRADVAEGTIFNLFGSKNELLAEVGRRYGEGLARAAFGGTALLEDSPDVEDIIGGIFEYVASNRELFVAFLWANDPQAGVAASALQQEMVEAISRQLVHGLERGETSDMDPEVAAQIQYSMVEGTLRDCFVRNGGENRARVERELIRSLKALLGQL